MNDDTRIVITGIGLSAPNGHNLQEFRENLLAGKSGIGTIDAHYIGEVIAGACDFDASRYQTKKELFTTRYLLQMMVIQTLEVLIFLK